jgi:hypothetical protein
MRAGLELAPSCSCSIMPGSLSVRGVVSLHDFSAENTSQTGYGRLAAAGMLSLEDRSPACGHFPRFWCFATWTTRCSTRGLSLWRRAFGEIVTVAFGDHRSAGPLLRQADVALVVRSSAPDETTHLLADVPEARLSVADSVGAWAEVILELASTAQSTRSSCSS